MTGPDRAGGYAALTQAASYAIGFGLFVFVLDRTGYDGASGNLAFALDNAGLMAFAMIALYIVFGMAQIVLSIALHRRVSALAPEAAQVVCAFGLIWAGLVLASGMIGLVGLQTMAELQLTEPDRAVTAWIAIGVVQNGLGGGIELVGGAWVALVSGLGFHKGVLPRRLNLFGLPVGLVGMATVLPGLGELSEIFGLAQLIWFAFLGFHFLRPTSRKSALAA